VKVINLVSPYGETVGQKALALTGSTFGVYGQFRSGKPTKQEPVDSLNLFNARVLITVMFVSVLQPNTTFY